jgi:putative membrane protein
MNTAAQVLTIVVALVLIGVGVLEAFAFRNQRFHGILIIRPEDTEAVRLWVVNAGFSDIVWGLGALSGVVLVNLGQEEVGRALVIFVSIAMIVLGFVLLFTELRLWRTAAIQVLLPVLVLIAMSF